MTYLINEDIVEHHIEMSLLYKWKTTEEMTKDIIEFLTTNLPETSNSSSNDMFNKLAREIVGKEFKIPYQEVETDTGACEEEEKGFKFPFMPVGKKFKIPYQED